MISFSTPSIAADQDLISVFPLETYDQKVNHWIHPNDPDYDTPLLTPEIQQKHVDSFYNHYFGASSPWNVEYINLILHQKTPNDLKSIEQSIIIFFNNQNKSDAQIGYGENFRPHEDEWIEKIAANINLSQFDHLTYLPQNRAIAVDNLHARALPTEDVHFYSHKLAGQGYPFDNLQMSALWAGTPVYILTESQDHAWSLVVAPDYVGWVKSKGLARVNNAFVSTWEQAAKNQLAVITRTETSLLDEKGQFLLSAYVGSVFPLSEIESAMELMVPAADADGHAVIKKSIVSKSDAALMPLAATPHHFANIMTSMVGRPYGWGSMYFYNDCSAEVKSILAPFGIWLPRHSSDQVTVGNMVDMTSVPEKERLAYLMKNGHKFVTLIYIGGHDILYIGNYQNPKSNDHTLMAMTYQNIWGLSPYPPARRAVIGKSVLFPMLLQYPEDTSLASLASKRYFQVSFLDQLPSTSALLKQKAFDLRSLMEPSNNI